jgi:hypothetical protein
MATHVAFTQSGTRWEHLLLGLREPCERVALVTAEPVEPAILAYYLELVGVGPWGRLALFEREADAREFARGDEAAPTIDARFARGRAGAVTVHGQIHDDGRVQLLAAQERLADGARYPAPEPDDWFRAAARAGGDLATAGAVGRFAVDFDRELVGVDAAPANHAYATLLALRANAFRAADAIAVDVPWRDAIGALRDAGVHWDPRARAGVVAFGLDTLSRTGTLGLVALGGSRTEAEERFATAVDALTRAPVLAAA